MNDGISNPLDREALLDQVVSDYLASEEQGTAPDRAELIRTYPEIADELRSFFEAYGHIEQVAAPLRQATAPLADALESAEFDDFELLDEIGRGGMGVVFRARQRSLNRLVAVKLLPGGRLASPEAVRRFQVEAEAAGTLDHANIVPVYQFGQHEGQYFYAMALVEGPSLAELLRDGPLEPQHTVEIVAAIGGAVESAHRRGIIHRDLKPSNVLMDREGTPRITDFGLATWTEGNDELTATGQIVGTPSYMPPEQCGRVGDGSRHSVGPTADVYALGAILYALLVGRPPFQAPTPLETMVQVRDREPVPPRQLSAAIPRDLQTICLKCLEKSPSRRYDSAQALVDDLRRYQRGEPIHARPAGLLDTALKWSGRHPAAAALMVVLVASLLLAVGGVALHNRQIRRQVVKAQEEAQRADRNYELARDALRQMVGHLDDRRIADVPKLYELRRQMLQDALKFFEAQLEQQTNPDPSVQLDVSYTYHQTGNIQWSLGQRDSALDCFRKAIEILDRLHAKHPDVRIYAERLAALLNNLGTLLSPTDEALPPLERSLALRTELAKQDSVAFRETLAESRHNLGSYALLNGQLDSAREHYQASAALRDEQLAAHPDDPLIAIALAETLANAALVEHARNDRDAARELHRRADELLRDVLRRDAFYLEASVSLADNLLNWGNLWRAGRRQDRALASYSEAIDVLAKVLDQEPDLQRARTTMWKCLGARATVLQFSLGRPAEAFEDWSRVIPLAPPHRLAEFRILQALAAAAAGKRSQALDVVRQFDSEPGTSGADCYNLACIVSQCANGDDLPGEESGHLREWSLRLLRRCRDTGYLREPGMLDHMLRDGDLVRLHELPGWQELLESMRDESQRAGEPRFGF